MPLLYFLLILDDIIVSNEGCVVALATQRRPTVVFASYIAKTDEVARSNIQSMHGNSSYNFNITVH